MRTHLDVYDQLLKHQAEASFALEKPLFEGFEAAHRVIDLGCGNASFTRRLAAAFPGTRFLGVDPNGPLLARGSTRALPPNLELFEGTFDRLAVGTRADVLLARLVMMYVREPEALARSVSRRVPTVIVVDNADELFDVRPALPLFSDTLLADESRRRDRGERRDTQDDTIRIWQEAGYQLVADRDIVVHSEGPSLKPLMHLVMVLNAELAAGAPLSAELLEELHGWAFDDAAYLRYGLRARRFERVRD